MLVAALSKLVPRALQKKVATTFRSSDSDTKTNTETTVCHVVLLDDTEIQFDIKVSHFMILDTTHAHTHTYTQPFYGSVDFVRVNPG